jgi:hypothetical protein
LGREWREREREREKEGREKRSVWRLKRGEMEGAIFKRGQRLGGCLLAWVFTLFADAVKV